jgi:alpha-beta hydrolase superfamily lysophospholipase
MGEILSKQTIQYLSQWREEFQFEKPLKQNKIVQKYLSYYNLPTNNIQHHFGKMNIKGHETIVQMFVPDYPIGTIVILHGYLDHVGHLNAIIQHLVSLNYRIITYDLKGHGLAKGDPATIESFAQYQETFYEIIERIRVNVPGPLFTIAHSTGAAIVTDYLLTKKNHPITKSIFLAPLVRSHCWHPAVIGHKLIKPFLQQLNRKYRANSNDENYLRFVHRDPLQYDALPLSWFEALIRWNKDFSSYEKSNSNLLIIQGDKDTTVDWKYNLDVLKDKFPKAKINIVKKGKHHLINEEKSIQSEVFDGIKEYLM